MRLELAQHFLECLVELLLPNILLARPFASVLADFVHERAELGVGGAYLIALHVYPCDEVLQGKT